MRICEKELKITTYSLELYKGELVKLQQLLNEGVMSYSLDSDLFDFYETLLATIRDNLEEE